MWVVYRKSDRKVVGLSADVDVDPDKDHALQEVVKGLVESQDVSQFDAFQVKERGKIRDLAPSLARGQIKVQDTKGGGLDLAEDKPDTSALVVTTNATSFHPVDKIPLLPMADTNGQPLFLVISIQKVDDQGKPLTRKTKDNDLIWLRTSAGTLTVDTPGQAAAGAATRSVTLAAGTGSFRLYPDSVLGHSATVHLLPTDTSVRGASLQVEFVEPLAIKVGPGRGAGL